MTEGAAVFDIPEGEPERHPLLLRLARALLSRSDRSRGERSARLSLDRKVAPELFAFGPDEMRRFEMRLDELVSTGWVGLRVTKPRAFQTFLDQQPALELLDFDALAAWAGFESRHAAWDRRFHAHLRDHLPDDAVPDKRALLDYLARSPLNAMAMLALEEATQQLLALHARSARPQKSRMYVRQASARVFHGRSKVLDAREQLFSLLGAHPHQFRDAPVQLLADIPPHFDQVLFVENLVTYEQMADRRAPQWTHAALLYAGGFRGSAKSLRSREGCTVYVRNGNGTAPVDQNTVSAFKAWLQFGS